MIKNFIFSLCLLAVSVGCTAAQQLPQWVETHRSERHPQASYLVGVGSGSTSESAQDQARAGLVAQIRVHIQSVISTYEQEKILDTGAEYYSEFERQTTSAVDETITGVEIAETARSRDGNTHYALAVLHRGRFSESARAELDGLWDQVRQLYQQGMTFRDQGRLAQSFESWKRAGDILNEAFAKEILFNVVSIQPYPRDRVITPARLTSDIRGTIAQLRFERIGGDNQTAELGKLLDEPLRARLVLRHEEGPVPVEGTTVIFTYESGDVLDNVITDSNGEARVIATARGRDARAGTVGRINARLSIPQLPAEFRRELAEVQTNFSFTILRTALSFDVSIDAPTQTQTDALQRRVVQTVERNGYMVSPDAALQLRGDVTTRLINTVDGPAGTMYTYEAEMVILLVDRDSGEVLGSVTARGRATGRSESEAEGRAIQGVRIPDREFNAMVERL